MKSLNLFILFLILSLPVSELSSEEHLPPNSIVITSEDLEKNLTGYDLYDILSLLRTRTGITFKTSSDIGAEDWILLRGLSRDSSRNVLILIDGMPLNNSYSDANEIEHLPPLSFIDRIIVYLPPVPARFGGYTSVIEIYTKNIFDSEISAGYGELKSLFLSGNIGGNFKDINYQGGIDYLKTDNLTGVRRTPPKEKEFYGDRSYWKLEPAGKIFWKLPGNSSLALYFQYLKSKKFFSDIIFRKEKEKRERDLLELNLNFSFEPWKESDLKMAFFMAREKDFLNLMMHPDVRDQYRFREGAKIDFSFDFPLKQRISLGGIFLSSYARENLGTPLKFDYTNIYGLYIEDIFSWGKFFSIAVGLRYDYHTKANSQWNPYFSISLSPFRGNNLYFIWGNSTRWPSISEFNEEDPQSGLESERLKGFEIGMRQKLIDEKLSMRLSSFSIQLDRETELFFDIKRRPPGIYWRNNPEKLKSDGLEAEIIFSPFKEIDGFINYTYNSAERKDKPANFSGPKNLANFGLNFRKKILNTEYFNARIILNYGGKAKGIQATGGKPTVLDDWLNMDIAFSFKAKYIEIFMKGSNIFDKIYETFDGRPMFRRVIVGGIKLNFI
ncbi:MAG: TonB-dependent receptor [Acidobacteriota bacterium]